MKLVKTVSLIILVIFFLLVLTGGLLKFSGLSEIEIVDILNLSIKYTVSLIIVSVGFFIGIVVLMLLFNCLNNK